MIIKDGATAVTMIEIKVQFKEVIRCIGTALKDAFNVAGHDGLIVKI